MPISAEGGTPLSDMCRLSALTDPGGDRCCGVENMPQSAIVVSICYVLLSRCRPVRFPLCRSSRADWAHFFVHADAQGPRTLYGDTWLPTPARHLSSHVTMRSNISPMLDDASVQPGSVCRPGSS